MYWHVTISAVKLPDRVTIIVHRRQNHMDVDVVSFSFLSNAATLARLCSAIPAPPVECNDDTHRGHENSQLPASHTLIEYDDMVFDADSLHEDEEQSDAPPGLEADQVLSASPPTVIECIVHAVDAASRRGRSEAFVLPLGAPCLELYEAVRWWLGDDRIVLFDIAPHAEGHETGEAWQAVWEEDHCPAGAVRHVLSADPDLPLGYASPQWDLDIRHDQLHELCYTTTSSSHRTTSHSPRRGRPAPQKQRVARFFGCHGISCRVEDVGSWAAVHTFVPVGHGTTTSIALAAPVAVAPFTLLQPSHDCPAMMDLPPTVDTNNTASLAVAHAASVLCPSLPSRQYYRSLPFEVLQPTKAVGHSPNVRRPVQVLVGYPPLMVGDLVVFSDTFMERYTLQVTESETCEHTQLRTCYGVDVRTNEVMGPLLCTQLTR